jgi:predicted nucleic acid-binding protein
MKYVLDASVAVKMLLPEQDSSLALALQDEFRRQVHELIAPDILPAEMGHVLTRAERKGIIKQGEAEKLILDFLTPCPELFSYGDLYDRALQLSSAVRIGFYDCLYIALAEREGCPVVTADERLVKLFPDQTASLDLFHT